jgi:hypothetical protein
LVDNHWVDGQIGHVVLSASQAPGTNTFSDLLQRAKFVSVYVDRGSNQQHVAVCVAFVQEGRDFVSELLGVQCLENCLDENVLRSWLLAVKIEVIRKHLLQGKVVGT